MGKSEVKGHLWLHGEFETILSYTIGLRTTPSSEHCRIGINDIDTKDNVIDKYNLLKFMELLWGRSNPKIYFPT